MNKLYVIGGLPRCGKTIILNGLIQRQPMIGVSSDAIRAGVRYLNKHKRIDETESMVEDQLPWEMMIGLIQRYDHQNIPLVVEGVIFTPERIKSLQLKNLELKAAFVGFSSDAFVERVIEHGKQNKDWIYDNIQNHEGDESKVREMMKGLHMKSIALKSEAEKYGYRFFDIEASSFEVYKDNVIEYLLT